VVDRMTDERLEEIETADGEGLGRPNFVVHELLAEARRAREAEERLRIDACDAHVIGPERLDFVRHEARRAALAEAVELCAVNQAAEEHESCGAHHGTVAHDAAERAWAWASAAIIIRALADAPGTEAPQPQDGDGCTCCRSGEHSTVGASCGAVRLHWRCYLPAGHIGAHRATDGNGTLSDAWYDPHPADCDCTTCAIRMVGSLED